METTIPNAVINISAQVARKRSSLARIGKYVGESWRRSGKNPVRMARIVGEIGLLRLLNGLPPSDYLLGHLHRPEIPWREKWNHLGHRQYEEFLWYFNDPQYRKISQSKLSEKALLETLGLATPRFRGYLNADAGRCAVGNDLKSADHLNQLLLRLLPPDTTRRFCIKELEGWAGSGFRAIEVRRTGEAIWISDLATPTVGPRSVDAFAAAIDITGEYLIEDYIDQHPAYAEFHPSSINGYRFWVLNEGGGVISVPFANLRFGRKGALVDNGADRIMAPVDPDSGRIDKGYELTLDRPEYLRHPDTGVALAGRTLPFYAEARQLAIEALNAFPRMNFAGVDIAIGKDGPVVLELNNHPGGKGTLVAGKPMRQVFSRALAGLQGDAQ